jgi:phenylpropionate dioxygenase-like ring-hydroxylating dioxygenase large terminal subunit
LPDTSDAMDEAPLQWPAEGLTRVPYAVFDDPQVYAREQQRVFRGPTWNYLGLDCEIPKSGDYKLAFVGDAPVILCRDENGEVNAMVNRCAHRGALLCFEKQGHREAFTCVYHNWSYDLRGNLVSVAFKRGVRGRGGMPQDFDNAEHGLERVRVASYRGIHFGTFSSETPPIERYLGKVMTGYLDRMYAKPMRVLGQHSQYLRNNWKLVMENVRDPYHASILHLFFGSFGLSRQTMKGEALLDERGWHHIVYTKRATDDIRGSEYEGGRIPNMKSHLKLADPKILEEWPEFEDGITNMVQTAFPAVTFQQISNCLGIRHLVPRGPEECELFWTLLGYEDDEDWKTKIRARQANLIGPAGLISLEDGAVTNFVQRGIRGRGAGAASVLELGGRAVESTEDRVTESTIRGFWKGYRETMGI